MIITSNPTHPLCDPAATQIADEALDFPCESTAVQALAAGEVEEEEEEE